MIKIDKVKLKEIILNGISSEDLNNNFDYSGITDMSFMFYGVKELETLPYLNTENVTTMFYMFGDCHNLKSISGLNTENVTEMNSMFNNCKKLKSVPELNIKKVNDMSFMFRNCKKLKSINNINQYINYDFSNIRSKYIVNKHPELFI